MMKVTAKGQTTLPAKVRDRLGITPGSEVELALDGDELLLNPVKAKSGLAEAAAAWPSQGPARRLRVRVSERGQITIPARMREAVGLMPGSEVVFMELDDKRRVKLVGRRRSDGKSALSVALDRLSGSADTGLSTEEILAMTREEWPAFS